MKHNGKKRSDYEQMISEAGYKQPSLLQQLVLPPILEGRDVDAESGIHPGKTLAIATALLLKLNKGKPGIKALVLTKDREQAQKVLRSLTQSLAAFNQGASTAVVGFSDLIKKEARQLLDAPDFVVSTPARLIDHIRRGNVELGAVERIFIDEDEGYESEFESDVCFVLSKLKESVQIVRFAYPREEAYKNFEQLLKRPVLIREKDFGRDQGTIEYSLMVGENKDELLVRAMLSLAFECVLIVIDSPVTAKKISSELKALQLTGLLAQKEGGRGRPEKAVDFSSRDRLDFIMVPREMLARCSLEGISHIIICEPAFWETDGRKQLNVSNLGPTAIRCLTLATPPEAKQLEAIEERDKVKLEKQNPPADADVIRGTIKRLLERMLQAGHPEELKAYAAAVKKEVPIGKRPLFIASLIKNLVRPEAGAGSGSGSASGAGAGARKSGEPATLFLGIGRTRDIGPREIAALFADALRIDKSRIGDIRVFDNYSFVEIDPELADKAIAVLSEKEVKGKKLVINYSRKKEEKRRSGPRRHYRD